MNRLAYTIREACEVSGISKSSIYNSIRAGTLRPRKYGKRTLILADDLRAWLGSLPAASIQSPISPNNAVCDAAVRVTAR
jgi:excisionase family DNA binding protein